MTFNHKAAQKVYREIDPNGTIRSILEKELNKTHETLATFSRQKGQSFANEKIYDPTLLTNLILLNGEVIYEFFKNSKGDCDSLKFLTQNLSNTSPDYLLEIAVRNIYFGLDSIQDKLIGDFIEEIFE